ncbi:peptidoglycan-recognition protein SB2-like [Macrosteles quadrilineatus]|uniref:peptidoglycan-recognition protein SB2-like n=1 Tax=Macrosteles quadrilineatus TaxID=74068 RepID=UPI0023E12D82|nr:peptidoglycan-recognition protein SB2-like [Macrosteles quadrilineatus]
MEADWFMCSYRVARRPWVTRREWGAVEPPEQLRPLGRPLTHLWWSYTGSDKCRNHEQCEKYLRDYQTHYIKADYPDLPHSFLIGGSGKVYEGRGLMFEPDRSGFKKGYPMRCIDIAFIGEFPERVVPHIMMATAKRFAKFLVSRRIVPKRHFVISFMKKKHLERPENKIRPEPEECSMPDWCKSYD